MLDREGIICSMLSYSGTVNMEEPSVSRVGYECEGDDRVFIHNWVGIICHYCSNNSTYTQMRILKPVSILNNTVTGIPAGRFSEMLKV